APGDKHDGQSRSWAPLDQPRGQKHASAHQRILDQERGARASRWGRARRPRQESPEERPEKLHAAEDREQDGTLADPLSHDVKLATASLEPFFQDASKPVRDARRAVRATPVTESDRALAGGTRDAHVKSHDRARG